jgi:hypothetical protein
LLLYCYDDYRRVRIKQNRSIPWHWTCIIIRISETFSFYPSFFSLGRSYLSVSIRFFFSPSCSVLLKWLYSPLFFFVVRTRAVGRSSAWLRQMMYEHRAHQATTTTTLVERKKKPKGINFHSPSSCLEQLMIVLFNTQSK